MKKDFVEYLGFDDEEHSKVGRPKLADSETKKKSLIIAGISFFIVTMLLIFGYGTLFGFNDVNLKAGAINNKNKLNKKVLIKEIKPLVKDITLKEETARKIYLTVLPSNATNKDIFYESSDESIVTVDDKGKIIGVSVGNATIIAKTKDGSKKQTEFNISVIENAEGKCIFKSLSKVGNEIEYQIDCNNAKIKEVQYKMDEDYKKILSKKMIDKIKLSKNDINKNITFKVIYYPNNSKITKYSTKKINNIKTTTKKSSVGDCKLSILNVKSNSVKYDITCNNASVTKIAYKIGNGSYIGIDTSNLADTIVFEESDVTRVIYFNVEYEIDGSKKIKTITKSSIIDKKIDTSKEKE